MYMPPPPRISRTVPLTFEYVPNQGRRPHCKLHRGWRNEEKVVDLRRRAVTEEPGTDNDLVVVRVGVHLQTEHARL